MELVYSEVGVGVGRMKILGIMGVEKGFWKGVRWVL